MKTYYQVTVDVVGWKEDGTWNLVEDGDPCDEFETEADARFFARALRNAARGVFDRAVERF